MTPPTICPPARNRVASVAAMVAVLAAAGCGEPSRDLVSSERPTTADAGAGRDEPAALDTAPPREPSPIETLRRELNLPGEGVFKRAGRSIVVADLSFTDVDDLSPLADVGLKSLDIRGTPVTDLSPLAGTRIDELFAEKTGVTDIGPLQGLPLDRLYLADTGVADLSPLRGMRLDELNLVGTPVADLSPLAGQRIGTLWLRRTKVADIGPLSGVPLVSLDIAETAVSDLSPITETATLRRLQIADTNVSDLTPLAGLSLERLVFTPSNITKGLNVVRGMTSLRQLDTRFDLEGEGRTLTPAEFWTRFDAGDASPTGG